MRTYVSMLRGINVGGQKIVKMEQLKVLYESLGFTDVRTYVQSGNVLFEGSEPDSSNLSRKIKERIRKSFNLEVSVFIRTEDELRRLIEENPFEGKDAGKLHVTFLSERPATWPLDEISNAKEGGEEFLISGKEIFLFLPNGYGRTKLSNNFFEKKLKVNATTRNWRTVNSLLSMAKESHH